MGSVIHLSRGRLRERERVRARKVAEGRIALVLGGGGITGAAYHLGVLTAMNAMSERASVNDFDLYVGTSAGSVVAACLANGITPEDMVLANLGHPGASIPGIGAEEIMQPDRTGMLRSLLRWPFGVLGALRRYAGHPFTTRLIDGLGALAEGLPPALYTTDGTERYLRRIALSRSPRLLTSHPGGASTRQGQPARRPVAETCRRDRLAATFFLVRGRGCFPALSTRLRKSPV